MIFIVCGLAIMPLMRKIEIGMTEETHSWPTWDWSMWKSQLSIYGVSYNQQDWIEIGSFPPLFISLRG